MANENPPRSLLVGRLSNLQELWERCRANHTLLLSNSLPEADVDDQEGPDPDTYDPDSFARMEENYEEVIDYILSRIPDTEPGSTSHGNEAKQIINRQIAPALKLPSISIPVFSESEGSDVRKLESPS
ncbi:uncharacterized protein LOC117179432 [Belonocnema kinseyi]|uniref:uncharacterized protein LOC117179432 n=1 Tax=Belonocnema kinseyi TaxID=2817044 RepID=UPI00143D38FB|nr:uncharacterized protein LOC117179432 [Belonocnema kinseyi]